jgi:hypothetical protein
MFAESGNRKRNSTCRSAHRSVQIGADAVTDYNAADVILATVGMTRSRAVATH